MAAQPQPPVLRAITRREFLEVTAGTVASVAAWPMATRSEANWNQGQVNHIIPTASHERFLIKVSFKSPQTAPPQITVNGKSTAGVQTDPQQGRFWRFDAPSLQPATQYELRHVDSGGVPLCDAWPLKTFPLPDSTPEHFRILAYTCAGGYDCLPLNGKTFFLDMTARRRLLARAMSFQPDAVIANGDHIYWDLETSQNKPTAKYTRDVMWPKFGGPLDLSVPMLHSRNLASLRRFAITKSPASTGPL